MFVDELEIEARAGRGGNGVVRWNREKYKPKGGPAGGNGGKGGDVYMRAVPDLSLLAKYRGAKTFKAENGESGMSAGKHGKDGDDLYIDVPAGATIYDTTHERTHVLTNAGETAKVLLGGRGGLGNEYFKSSTNRAPQQATKGKAGEYGAFRIELSLLVDIGLVGLPNAGKSTLLNALTNAHARTGAYPFTTLEPHLGDLYGFTIADIPGLIEGASKGKGLGDKFLRHVSRTKMLLHCISLENDDPTKVYQVVRSELEDFDTKLLEKEEWVVLTKSDLVDESEAEKKAATFKEQGTATYVVSAEQETGVKELSDALTKKLQSDNS
jgi:GTP-binding protein